MSECELESHLVIMKYFLSTDTHFFHEKMYEYCDRPVKFEFLIQKGWKNLDKDDILIHLGDICIGRDAKAHDMFIKPLVCKKWLIKGNHDRKSDSWYMSNGWDFVGNEILLRKFGKRILLTHRPALDGNYDINVHGHCHNKEGKIHNKNKLLSLEKLDYKLITLQKFLI